MTRIPFSKLSSGDTERLARVARRDDIHKSTPRVRIECGNIIPDRTRAHGRFFQPGYEAGSGVSLPFNSTYGAIFWEGKV
jgi:hypothetical protein